MVSEVKLLRLATYFALYLFGAALCGSLLAYGVAPLIDVEFSKVMSRALLLFAGLGLVPLWRAAGLDARAVGLSVPSRARRETARRAAFAFGWSVLMMLPLMLFFLVVGFRVLDPRVVLLSSEFAALLFMIVLGAVLASLLEEVLFRGVLLSALERAGGFGIGAILTSVLYASVHFLERDEVSVADPAWYTGLELLGSAMVAMFSLDGQWDAWLSLFLLGGLLCWVRRTGGLWLCIALHAGWIVAIRLFKELTVRDVENPFRTWVSDFDNFIGWLVVFWLVFCGVVIALYRSHRPPASPPPASP